MRKAVTILIFSLILFLHSIIFCQNVVIVVIDGARYSETFGAKETNIPKIWGTLRTKGMIWTNFRNEGLTKSDPGHASIVTGTCQIIDNKGESRPTQPTIFEYFRKASGAPESAAAVIVGKQKLEILTYSTHTNYGEKYKAFSSILNNDISVVNILKATLKQNKPRITIVNLPNTDRAGHSENWKDYISAIRTADSLIYDIWQTLQTDSFYCNNTTLFVTNDHGRHDDLHGGFKSHGNSCEGCRHIILLAIGRGFPSNRVITKARTQCDIAPTVGELLSFPTENSTGTSLLRDTVSVAP